MAGFDKHILGLWLKERGWIEVGHNLYKAPPYMESLLFQPLHVYDAEQLHLILVEDEDEQTD